MNTPINFILEFRPRLSSKYLLNKLTPYKINFNKHKIIVIGIRVYIEAGKQIQVVKVVKLFYQHNGTPLLI